MGQGPGTHRHNAKQKAQAKTDGERYVELRAKGYSIRQIARIKGVSHSTVSLRIAEELKTPAPALEEMRALENAKYDAWELELYRLKKGSEDPEVIVSVHARLARIAELRTRLNGIAAPVKVDPDLVVSTAATTAAATATAVAEAKASAPAVTIVLSSEVGADEET